MSLLGPFLLYFKGFVVLCFHSHLVLTFLTFLISSLILIVHEIWYIRVWCVYIQDCDVFLINFPSVRMTCLSLSHFICFSLKSILSDSKIVTPLASQASLLGIFFLSFHLKVVPTFKAKLSYLYSSNKCIFVSKSIQLTVSFDQGIESIGIYGIC